MHATNRTPWSPWHLRLHKKLIANSDLLPNGASLLLAVSGGQDSMVLLKLIIDLQRLHAWKLHVWHGDHNWHDQSGLIAKELKEWCASNNLSFFSNSAKNEEVKNEAMARDWRYEKLKITAKIISSQSNDFPCTHILTGHTASDRAETLILNLARGTDLTGLSSLPEHRSLNKEVQLIRPLLGFSRSDTAQICNEMKLPIWIDPSNQNLNISRNRVRQQIIPILEELHPGCSMRIASLAERLAHYKENQHAMILLLLKTIKHPKGLCRKKFSDLPLTAKATVLAGWLKHKGAPVLTASQLEELSRKIGPTKPPGCQDLPQKWKIKWGRESIKLEPPKTVQKQ